MAPKLLWKERTAAVLARNQRVVVVFPKRLVTMLSEHGLGEIAVQHCGESRGSPRYRTPLRPRLQLLALHPQFLALLQMNPEASRAVLPTTYVARHRRHPATLWATTFPTAHALDTARVAACARESFVDDAIQLKKKLSGKAEVPRAEALFLTAVGQAAAKQDAGPCTSGERSASCPSAGAKR